MDTRYTLEPLSAEEISGWDALIAPFPNRSLFHRKVWMDWLVATRGVEARYWIIRRGGEVVGYFCGGMFRKGPYKILGSPLKGWLTNDIGPIFAEGFDVAAFMKALDEMAREERVAMIEMESPALPDAAFAAQEYRPTTMPVYIVEITEDPAAMLAKLHPKARKAVRKAQEFAVKVVPAGEGFAAELYDQYREILARKSLYPTFHPSCPQKLLEMLPQDLMFALDVRSPEGTSIATGMFPHDDRAMYFSFTGSRIAGWKYFPNDILQWTAMEMASARGLKIYNMCGYGQFKSKFGGTLEKRNRWYKTYSASARWARRGYEMFFMNRMRLRGWLENRSQGGEA